MARIRLGCAGWSYDDWKGGFYPPGTTPGQMLARYARVFDLVEVDGTHYRPPTRELCTRWDNMTPPGFLFALKLPGLITHDAKLRNVDGAMNAFEDAVEPLRKAGKLAPILAQFGPDFTRPNDADALTNFLDTWPRTLPLAIEFRHDSWWTEATYDTLRARNATLTWATTHHGRTPAIRTTSDVYLRLIGDRALTRFDRIQRDDAGEMAYWRAKILIEGANALHVYVIANNHFLGFGPGTLLRMAEILDVKKPDLAAAAREQGQPGLGDFGE